MDSFGQFQLPQLPFGYAYFGKDGQWIGDREASQDAPENDGSMPTIFAKENCTPASMGGKPISRHMMNKLGYLATLGTYLDRIGYPYGNTPLDWDASSDSNAAGYPKGAIVSIYDETRKVLREYLSLVDNNTDTDPWDWADTPDGVMSDYDTLSYWESKGHWKPLFTLGQYNYFPDYSNKTELLNETAVDTERFEIPIAQPCWVMIERTILEFANLQWQQVLNNPSGMAVTIWHRKGDTLTPEEQQPLATIMPFEGMETSRLIPVGQGTLVVTVNNNFGIVSEDNEVSSGSINVVVSQLGFEQS